MAFLHLRENNQIYVLHKDTYVLEVGRVTNTPSPTYKYNNAPANAFQPQMPTQVVDLVVNVGECNYNFQQLPAMSEIVDYEANGNVVIACSKGAIENEIYSIKRRSEERLASREEDENIIKKCDTMLNVLNPEIEERKRVEQENAELRSEMKNLQAMMADLIKQMGEKPPKTK